MLDVVEQIDSASCSGRISNTNVVSSLITKTRMVTVEAKRRVSALLNKAKSENL